MLLKNDTVGSPECQLEEFGFYFLVYGNLLKGFQRVAHGVGPNQSFTLRLFEIGVRTLGKMRSIWLDNS